MSKDREAAAHNRFHNGTAGSIRDCLRNSPDPMSCYQIALYIGKPPQKVRVAISQMIAVSGGIVASKGPRGIVYSLYKPPVRKEQAGPKAGRIIYPGYVYGASRLG